PADIPAKILAHNLYGIEIDERAGELAAFALVMKAARGNPKAEKSNHRRFFRNPIQPNICVLESIQFQEDELSEYMDFVGYDLFTAPLQNTLRQFEEADNFGSLIQPALEKVDDILRTLAARDVSGQLFLTETHKKVLRTLRQADYLTQKYHVVVANPPYMNAKGMNSRLKSWTTKNFPLSKADFMTMFMERSQLLGQRNGYWSMINIPTWMFLDSFENLRLSILKNQTVQSLVHLGRGVFGSDFGTVAFSVKNSPSSGESAVFRRLFERHVDVRSQGRIEELFLNSEYNRYVINPQKFVSIPGAPFAYWATPKIFKAFQKSQSVRAVAKAFRGISTGDNERFSRVWHEVARIDLKTDASSREEAANSGKRWFPYNRGGSFRKWFGLGSEVIDYEAGGKRMVNAYEQGETPGFRHDGSQGYFLSTVTWGALTAGKTSFRRLPRGYVLGHKGPGIVANAEISDDLLLFLNSRAAEKLLSFVSPTLDTNISHLLALPFRRAGTAHTSESAFIDIAKSDWDDHESSWDFTMLPL
ncbi:MAG: Eco57I restriction-modification methylase domain-containing protein, partial [Cyclobacteriaceae bacterium]